MRFLSMLCLAASAILSAGIGLAVALADFAFSFFEPGPPHARFLDRTPRSIVETRRMGLA